MKKLIKIIKLIFVHRTHILKLFKELITYDFKNINFLLMGYQNLTSMYDSKTILIDKIEAKNDLYFINCFVTFGNLLAYNNVTIGDHKMPISKLVKICNKNNAVIYEDKCNINVTNKKIK